MLMMVLMNLMERKLDSLKIRDLCMIQVDLTYYAYKPGCSKCLVPTCNLMQGGGNRNPEPDVGGVLPEAETFFLTMVKTMPRSGPSR
jgi:hypothetical protein